MFEWKNLQNKYGVIKCGQIVFQFTVTLVLVVVLNIQDSSWFSKTGIGLSVIMLIGNLLIAALLLTKNYLLEDNKNDIECVSLVLWVVLWILEYLFASLYSVGYPNKNDLLPPIYYYECGFVIISVMVMVEIVSLSVLQHLDIKDLIEARRHRQMTPQSSSSDFQVLDISETIHRPRRSNPARVHPARDPSVSEMVTTTAIIENPPRDSEQSSVTSH